MTRTIKYLSERLDLLAGMVVALGGAVVAGGAYFASIRELTEAGLVILCTSTLYLLFRNRITCSTTPSIPSRTSLTLVLNIIFVSALAASLFFIHYSCYRPLIHFLLISICATTVAAEVLSSKTNYQVGLLLFKILLIALVLRAGIFYEMPGLIGADSWLHEVKIAYWMDIGHITTDMPGFRSGYTGYAFFPALHLMVMMTRLVTDVLPKDSLFLSVGVFYTVSILFVFLIGQRLLGRTAGLIAALFISIIAPHVNTGATLIPNSLGLAIFTIILFLVIRKKPYNTTNVLLFITFSIVLVLTHTISSFITLITLALILIAQNVWERLEKDPTEKINIGVSAVMLFTVLIFGYWASVFYYPDQTFFTAVARGLYLTIKSNFEFIGEVVQVPSAFPANRIWYHMFIGLVVIGTLSWLSSKMRNNLRMTIITSTVVLALIVVILPSFNIKNLLTTRWVPFIIVIGAALVAQGILAVSAIAKGKVMPAVVLVALIFSLSMFSVNSSGVNRYTPFYEKPTRNDFIQSELDAANTIVSKYDSQIFTDWAYSEFIFLAQTEFTDLRYLEPEMEEEASDLIVIRNHRVDNPELMNYYWRPDRMPTTEEIMGLFSKFDSSNLEYNLIYNNGEVKVHSKK